MKRYIITFLLALFLTASLGLGISVGSDTYGKVDSVKGSVSVIRSDKSLKAAKDMVLLRDDSIKTGDDSAVTIAFQKGVTGSLESNQEMTLDELLKKSIMGKLDSLKKKSIKRPDAGAAPSKINVDTIGGTRGTEEVEKKSKSLKNDHTWEEKVD